MNQSAEPIPIGSLLREQSGVLEAEGLQVKGKLRIGSQGKAGICIGDGPFVGQIKELPFTAAFCASVIMAVFLFPAGMVMGSIPDDLGIRAHQ